MNWINHFIFILFFLIKRIEYFYHFYVGKCVWMIYKLEKLNETNNWMIFFIINLNEVDFYRKLVPIVLHLHSILLRSQCHQSHAVYHIQIVPIHIFCIQLQFIISSNPVITWSIKYRCWHNMTNSTRETENQKVNWVKIYAFVSELSRFEIKLWVIQLTEDSIIRSGKLFQVVLLGLMNLKCMVHIYCSGTYLIPLLSLLYYYWKHLEYTKYGL